MSIERYAEIRSDRGQNVNKLSTKATVRLILSASPWIPFYALTNLTTTSYYSKLPPPTGSIILQSSSFRTQPQNLSDGLSKLKSIILGAASEGLIGETSELQKKKVANLEKQEKVCGNNTYDFDLELTYLPGKNYEIQDGEKER